MNGQARPRRLDLRAQLAGLGQAALERHASHGLTDAQIAAMYRPLSAVDVYRLRHRWSIDSGTAQQGGAIAAAMRRRAAASTKSQRARRALGPGANDVRAATPSWARVARGAWSSQLGGWLPDPDALAALYGARTYEDSVAAARPEPRWRPPLTTIARCGCAAALCVEERGIQSETGRRVA